VDVRLPGCLVREFVPEQRQAADPATEPLGEVLDEPRQRRGAARTGRLGIGRVTVHAVVLAGRQVVGRSRLVRALVSRLSGIIRGAVGRLDTRIRRLCAGVRFFSPAGCLGGRPGKAFAAGNRLERRDRVRVPERLSRRSDPDPRPVDEHHDHDDDGNRDEHGPKGPRVAGEREVFQVVQVVQDPDHHRSPRDDECAPPRLRDGLAAHETRLDALNAFEQVGRKDEPRASFHASAPRHAFHGHDSERPSPSRARFRSRRSAAAVTLASLIGFVSTLARGSSTVNAPLGAVAPA
jgi:hypothetical protein